jgi:tetratricopeptide (TPR) repeat protein
MGKPTTKTLKELQKFIKAKGKEYKTDMEDVPAWVIVACAEFIDSKKETEPNKIKQEIGQYLSGDGDYDKIIEALKEALKENPDKMVEDVEYTEEDGINTTTISVWEPLEGRYTVQEFCDLIGLR